MKQKYVIVSPEQGSGGSIVLHALCKYLSDLGYDAKIFYVFQVVYPSKIGNPVKRLTEMAKYWKQWCHLTFYEFIVLLSVQLQGERSRWFNRKKGYEAVKGCRRKWTPFLAPNTVVIYPEVVYGNILHAKNVVRWMLYHYSYADDPNAYDRNDMFVCYREVFNNFDLNPSCRTLHASYFDLKLYRQTNFGSRQGTCYVVRKGRKRTDLPTKFDGIVIDSLPEEEIVRVFNSCERCISYDTQTSYSSIAAMCGCLSIVVPEPGKGRNDYIRTGDAGLGVAFGFSEDELNFARTTQNKVRECYEKKEQNSIKNIRQFIPVMEDYFSTKRRN